MFAEMRRKDRAMEAAEAECLLVAGEYGILAVNGLNGFPHPVPMSYAYKDGVIWLHCAMEGTKLDDIRSDARVSFTVVGATEVLPEKFSTNYQSVICYGEVVEISGKDAETGLFALVEKYAPGFEEEGKAYITRAASKTSVLRMDIRHMTGKARR